MVFMNTKKVYQLEVLEHGIIQLLIQTVYFKEDGSELTRENWRTTLMPTDIEYAEELLDEYHLNIVKAVWTEEIVEAYALKMTEIEKQ
uniref:Uncharacterized protein n=1 Tax=Siphoviridae sp. ctqSm5 TaxID=2827949 RepID=A0A8S5SP96_9CAUD|nr:MAG TPA: hypothetical protein [Siphoviridae sp. ctqSm5]